MDTDSSVKSTVFKRIWEVDFLRGLAILAMVILHFIFVTTVFFDINLFKTQDTLFYITTFLQDYGGTIFIIISGISCIFSKNNFKRGSQLFIIAMLITYVTTVFNYMIIDPGYNNYIVRFGILHLLSVCMMLAPIFLKLKSRYLLPISVILILIGNYCRQDAHLISIPALTGYEILPWFRSADYFPLLPYTGYFIIGIIVGRLIYKNKHSIFKSEILERNIIIRFFTFCGRHTLAIYLAHQPILFGTLYLLKAAKIIG